MSIDWEELLGAEGDGLQDAYDRSVEDWDRLMDPAPKPARRRSGYGARRRRPKEFRLLNTYEDPMDYEEFNTGGPMWRPASPKKTPLPPISLDRSYLRNHVTEPTPELEAIRARLEGAYQTDFHWIRFPSGVLASLADPEERLVYVRGAFPPGMACILYPFDPHAAARPRPKGPDGKDLPLLEARYQDRDPHWEYSPAGLPQRLLAAGGETLWDREACSESLSWTWLFFYKDNEIVPSSLFQDGILIWEDAAAKQKADERRKEFFRTYKRIGGTWRKI